MRRTNLAVAATATATAVAGTLGLSGAAAAPTPAKAATRMEFFTVLNTSATSTRSSLIATGAFNAGGTDVATANPDVDVLHFPGGTVKLVHKQKTSKGGENAATCVLVLVQTGTYKLSGGTGVYQHLTGSGTYSDVVRMVLHRAADGTCSQKVLPDAFQFMITAKGPVAKS